MLAEQVAHPLDVRLIPQRQRHMNRNHSGPRRRVSEVDLGASPRATLALYRCAQARAAIAGRDFVLPDDVKFLAPYVLTHRIQIGPQTRLRGRRPEDVIIDLVNTIPVPVEH